MHDEHSPAAAESGGRTARQKLWLVAKILLALLALAMLVALALLRTWPPLNVVLTSSMEPKIEAGEVVVMGRLGRPAEVGDIVEVRPPQEIQERLNYPDRVIHRIVRITPDGTVFTKGDARERRDPFTVQRDDVDVRVVGKIPGVGQIVAFFTSPLGLLWLAAGALLFIVLPYYELRRDQVELEKAELGSLAHLRIELEQIGKRVEAEQGGGSRAPPALPAAAAGPEETAVFEEDDWTDFEGEIEAMRQTMDDLVGAVGEYGEHLRSHTEVLEGMSAASQDLAAIVAALRAALPGAAVDTVAAAAAAGDQQAVGDAERILSRWREARALDIAGWMGFRDPRDAARLADLGAATDDQGVERALEALASEKPYLLRDA